MLRLVLIVVGSIILSCSGPKKSAKVPFIKQDSVPGTGSVPKQRGLGRTDTLLENILKLYPRYFEQILDYRDSFSTQIIYTQIDRRPDNSPVFTDFYFNVNRETYFYPASTIKMPIALLALQKLNELKIKGLDKYTTMITETGNEIQTPVYNDPTSREGMPSVAQYIRKIFLVSDNDASNRLYEFIGQEYLNEQLRKKGFSNAEIIHRLNIFLTEDQNRQTNPVKFIDTFGSIIYEQQMRTSQLPRLNRNEFLGKGFIRGNQLVKQPFDFSRRNRIALQDLHQILKAVLFPEALPADQRFDLNADDYRFVRKYMSQYPPETAYPPYDTINTWDAYCKFLYWGNEKGNLPRTFRIFNKVGDAYGFLTDIAYIVDFEKNMEFMLSATILCNSDGVFNDSKYDYDSVGFPFMKNLGRVIYDYELKRKRARIPDLSSFKIEYDR